jgi:hypothetical protein
MHSALHSKDPIGARRSRAPTKLANSRCEMHMLNRVYMPRAERESSMGRPERPRQLPY